jgi:hypothetical protein
MEIKIFIAGKLVDEMGIAHSTANRLLLDFEKLEIIDNNYLQRLISPMHAKWFISSGKTGLSTAKISDFAFSI